MIDKRHVGKVFPPTSVEVEAGQLRFFAKAIGETNPICFDVKAAAAAGYPALPAPPTFAFSLSLLAPQEQGLIDALGIDITKILHGEQGFEYHRPIFAGDVVTLSMKVTDIYDKKGGALEFVTTETDVVNQRNELCVRMSSVTVVRH